MLRRKGAGRGKEGGVSTFHEAGVALDVSSRGVDLSSGPVCGLLADLVFADVEEEDGADQDEDYHGDDLESETSDHDVDALEGVGLGGC